MPYLIEEGNTECGADQWTTVKNNGDVMGCHDTKQEAIDQALAIADAEGSEYLGERAQRNLEELLEDAPGGGLPDAYRPATSEDVPEGRACGNCIFFNEARVNDAGEAYCEWWEAYAQGGFYCNAWRGREIRPYDDDDERDELPSEPAPKEDQVEGSDENEPGSAKGPGGADIKLSEATETALRNKVSEHNEAMEEDEKPAYTRTTYGQLAAVYRRGAGAYSTSHRPGIPRAAWAMARVNAYLYLLRNGRPQNAAYVTDNDLLPEDHPRSTRSADLEIERRQVDLSPPAYMRAAARQGLKYYDEGLAGDGLTSRTVTEARQIARGDALTPDKWSRTVAWIARHMADLDAPGANPTSDDYPTPGVVAHLLWGSGPSRRAAERAEAYASGVVGRLEEENSGRARGEAVAKLETRTSHADFEVRELEDGGLQFEGYAAVFNSASEPLPFTERIAPGAFARSIRSRNNIMMLFNHDAGQPLASTRAGTMSLTEDERGLKVTASLAPTSLGRDISTLVKTRVIDSMSFGFSVVRDSWNRDGSERMLESVRLFEVSLVSFPAYEGTAGTASVRGLDRIAKRASVDADAVADVLLKVEGGQEIDGTERELITKVLDELSPQETVETGQSDADVLALKKLKLKLLEL